MDQATGPRLQTPEQQELVQMNAAQAALLDALPARAALIDAAGMILAVNAKWAAAGGSESAWPPAGDVGTDYPARCTSEPGVPAACAKRAALGLRSVLAGRIAKFSYDHDGVPWGRMVVTRLNGSAQGALVQHLPGRLESPAAPGKQAILPQAVRQQARGTSLVLSAAKEVLRKQSRASPRQPDRGQDSGTGVSSGGAASTATGLLEAHVQSRTADLCRQRDVAESANRSKTAFLAAMSHEIRTPMNGVVGMIDVLAHGPLLPEQRDTVRAARAAAFALLAVVDDVLDFSKIEAGQFHVDVEPLNIEGLVEGVCETLATVAVKNAVSLELFIDPTLPSQFLGDPARLRQVLLNLLGNAIKFSSATSHAGRIQVRAVIRQRKPNAASLELSVTDNGIGMDDAMMARLFMPFVQAHAAADRHFGGTGLGLSISQALVKLMGGHISVRSALGRGASFTVSLPLPPTAQPAVTVESPELAGVQCLVLGPVRQGADLATYLRHSGAAADVADSLGRACAKLRARTSGPCIVVVCGNDTAHQALTDLRIAGSRSGETPVRLVVVAAQLQGPALTPAQPGVIYMDATVLYRQNLIHAVSVLAGRAAPRNERLLSAISAPAAPAIEISPDSRRILVAEDNEINQLVLRKQLALLGFATDIANNGREALAMLQQRDYLMLLTDLHMPGMNGFELAASIRTGEAGHRRMPIVALTANAQKSEALRCIGVGIDECLVKPLPIETLHATLTRYLTPALLALTSGSSGGDTRGVQDAKPPADLAVLASHVGADPKATEQVLLAFRSSAVRVLSELDQAARISSLQEAFEAAHRFESGASAVGALRLAGLCRAIQSTAEAGQAIELEHAVSRFRAELRAVRSFLDTTAITAINVTGTVTDRAQALALAPNPAIPVGRV